MVGWIKWQNYTIEFSELHNRILVFYCVILKYGTFSSFRRWSDNLNTESRFRGCGEHAKNDVCKSKYCCYLFFFDEQAAY